MPGVRRTKNLPAIVEPIPRAQMPDNLEPLGYRVHDYPHDVPLIREECRTALWLSAGNVSKAAVLLKTTSARLGNFVKRDEYLAEERQRAAELALDRAEAVMLDALEADDTIRRDEAARFVLMNAGRQRGWSREGGVPGINVAFQGSGPAGAVQIRWQTAEDTIKTIEHQ